MRQEGDRWLGCDGWRWENKDGQRRLKWELTGGVGKSWSSKVLGCWPGWGSGERLEVSRTSEAHLVQDVLVEVGHVALAGHGAIIIISEVLLQGHRVMGDMQDRVQVVGQHLRQSGSLPFCTPKLG